MLEQFRCLRPFSGAAWLAPHTLRTTLQLLPGLLLRLLLLSPEASRSRKVDGLVAVDLPHERRQLLLSRLHVGLSGRQLLGGRSLQPCTRARAGTWAGGRHGGRCHTHGWCVAATSSSCPEGTCTRRSAGPGRSLRPAGADAAHPIPSHGCPHYRAVGSR